MAVDFVAHFSEYSLQRIRPFAQIDVRAAGAIAWNHAMTRMKG